MLILALAALHAAASVAPLTQPAQSSIQQFSGPALSDDDLLLFSVELDQLTLTDTLTAHGDPDDPLIPVGELSRLLDLDVDVFPADRRITGTVGEARRSILLDFKAGVFRVAGANLRLTQSDVGFTASDLYIRASVLQHILPVHFEVSSEALSIKLTALEKLPIEDRLERIARLRNVGASVETASEPTLKIASPYRLFTAPSFDVAVEGGRDTRTLQSYSGRYDIRVAGDVLYSDFQGYLGSDDRGRPSSARLLFERRSNDGDLPLGATRMSAGDVFTPALSLGPRSVGGRGFSFSTAALEQTSVFDTVDLRGELPIGYDVELYVNDVLRSGQRTPVQGRYEFLKVPLARGVNVIRIVLYGPRGERSQTVRIINVGGGQLRKHQTQFEFGVVDEDRALIEPQTVPSDELTVLDGRGLRAVASTAYGLTEGLTLVGGAAFYTEPSTKQRDLATMGIRTGLAGLALQVDAAADTKGGLGLGLGLAGQLGGVSTLLQHTEYRGGFVDETVTDLDVERFPVRHTALTLDFSLPPIIGKRVPLSLRAVRDEFADGGTSYIASTRASVTLFDTFVSSGVDFQRTSDGGRVDDQLIGNVSASKFLNFKWQLRATADYQLMPTSSLRDFSFTADRSLSDRLALRLGVGQTLGKDGDTFAQAGSVLHLPFIDLALNADYSLRKRDWSLNVRVGFGSLFNPVSRHYIMTTPGPASGGSAVVHAFLDRDGDGRFTSGDEPISKISLEGGQHPAVTDASGSAVVTGLGTAPTAAIQVNTKYIDEFYIGASPTRIEFAPRPGQVVQVPYPVVPVGEVYARFLTAQSGGKMIGLSAVQVALVRDGHEPISGVTEFDGSVVFSNVPLGTYNLELAQSQAERLGMRLASPVRVIVGSDKDAEVNAIVEFGGKAPVGTAERPPTGVVDRQASKAHAH